MSSSHEEQLLDDFLEHYALDTIYTDMTVEEYFEHFGVKGMRWGVIRKDGGRRNTSTVGSVHGGARVGVRVGGNSRPSGFDKTSAAYNKTSLGKVTTSLTRVLASGPYTAVQTAAIIALAAGTGGVGGAAMGAYAARQAASHTIAAVWANKDNVRRINASPKYKGKNLKTNPKLRKEYHKDQIDSFKKALWDPRGMRLAETKSRVIGGGPGAKSLTISGKDLHHAEESSDIIVDLVYNGLGQIIEFKPRVPDELQKAFDDIVDGDLSHVDPSEETLEDVGLSDATVDFLAHYGVLGMRWGKRKGDASGSSTSSDTTHEEHIKVQALRKKKISELSTAEMKLVTDRMNTEKKYRELNPSDHELLMRRLKKYASTGTKVVAFMATPNGKLLMKSMGFDVDTKRAEIKLKEQAKKDAAKEKKQSSKAAARAAEKKRIEDNKRSNSAADIANLRERAKRQ